MTVHPSDYWRGQIAARVLPAERREGRLRVMTATLLKVLGTSATLLLGIIFATPASATTITFAPGLTSPSQPGGTSVGNYYAALGVVSPNLRFHDSTYPGNVPFNFVDGWGAVADFGILQTATVFINFASPADYVEITGLAQSDFSLGGTVPYQWTVLAYGLDNSLVTWATETFGFDFGGSPNPPDTAPYPLERLFLRVDALGAISRIEATANRKWGIDTLAFAGSTAPVPVPAALPLFASSIAALGLIGWRRKRRVAAVRRLTPRRAARCFRENGRRGDRIVVRR